MNYNDGYDDRDNVGNEERNNDGNAAESIEERQRSFRLGG